MQQISPQSRFALYDQFDHNQVSRLGTLTVTEVRGLSSVATVTSAGQAWLDPQMDIVAVQIHSGSKDDLKIFIPPGNNFLSEYRNLERRHGVDGICHVRELGNANIQISLDRGIVSLEIQSLRRARLVTQKRERRVRNEPGLVAHTLSQAAHFFRHLKPASTHSDSYIYNNVTLKIFRLVDDYDFQDRKPIEPNLFDGEIIAIRHEAEAHHGIQLINWTNLDLYINAFIFSFGDLSIRMSSIDHCRNCANYLRFDPFCRPYLRSQAKFEL